MKIEQMIPRELDYKDNVKFTAKLRDGDNNCCDGCHRLGKVTVIIMPETKHYGGEELRTIYSSCWLCDSCLSKLKNAIENPKPEQRG